MCPLWQPHQSNLENGHATRLLEPVTRAHLFIWDWVWLVLIRPGLHWKTKINRQLQEVSVGTWSWWACLTLKHDKEAQRRRWLGWNCWWNSVEARFKLVWLRSRCDWPKMVLISSQGWCKTCRARLNASNPGCFTENNPGTAASAPGSCAGAAFKETEAP